MKNTAKETLIKTFYRLAALSNVFSVHKVNQRLLPLNEKRMLRINQLFPKKRIAVFCGIAFALMIIMSVMYYKTRSDGILTLCMLTPAVSVILTRLFTHQGMKALYIKPQLKNGFKWCVAAWFAVPFVAYFGAAVYFLIFQEDFSMLDSSFAVSAGVKTKEEYISLLLKTIPLAVLINPIMGVIQCFGEEFAWRGYLLPELNKKFSPLTASALTGVIWGLWHAPIIAMGYNYGTEHPIAGIFAMVAFCVVLGMITGFLFFKTRSVWSSVIFHAAINGIDLYSPSDLFMGKAPNAFIGPDLVGIIGGCGFVFTAAICMIALKKIKET